MTEAKTVAALFPTPPPFWQHFTKQNISRIKQLRKEAAVPDPAASHSDNTSEEQKDLDILSLPPELRYLVPPTPPSNGKFSTFGTEVELNAPWPSLKSFGIEQLYPDTENARLNPQSQLIAMSRSLLTTFLSLTGVLANDPEQQEPLLAHVQTLMYNMHDLINQYRPHQARESLILMMEERVEQMRAEVKKIDESKAKVEKLLAGLKDGELAHGIETEAMNGHKKENKEDLRRKSRQRAAWKALETELG